MDRTHAQKLQGSSLKVKTLHIDTEIRTHKDLQ
jgi:hypothetical protein